MQQTFFAALLVFVVGLPLVVLPLGLDLDETKPVVPLILLGLMSVVWVVSATGGAVVDDTGVRWRLFRPVAVGWADVVRVELGRATDTFQGPGVSRLGLRIAVRDGRELVIGPPLLAEDAGRRFGLVVADRAGRRGIPVGVTAPGWGVDG